MPNPSPLRYPGGKSRLSDFVGMMINNIGISNCTYVEPFAGGAGVALSLLLDRKVENIVINDFDKAIYSFWRAVKEAPDELINRIENTPVTIDEWYKQKEIYLSQTKYSVDLAFATLFLNRTNRSGILTAGPIGGYSQAGEWKLDVRFKRSALIAKIKAISVFRNHISVYNKDIISLLNNYIPRFGENIFIYFDPPYYNKGQKLYKNFLTSDDHRKIHDVIVNNIDAPWIMTYDDVPEIANLYAQNKTQKFDLIYSAANKGKASELLIYSNKVSCPTKQQLLSYQIPIDFRECV
ncbi:MAG: DNA adenine methylase [Dorea sp.]|jgi:Site-specific DNA methylase|nr:DNA adenine methylase [Dorea sp.]